VLCAPMALIAGGRLVAAVSDAGGLGILGGGYAGALGGEPDLEKELALVRGRKFGVGFITWALERASQALEAALKHSPYCVFLSFGEPKPYAKRIHDAGAKVICHPFPKSWCGAALHPGMGLGPPEGSRSFGSVRDCTCSKVASGASSCRSKPCGVTSMTASSVTMWSTTSTPVSGSVHFFRILGLLSRVACSMAMNTRFAPATRSMAPPMPLSILPGMAQLASVPFSSTCSA